MKIRKDNELTILLMGKPYTIKIVTTEGCLRPDLAGHIDYKSKMITIDTDSTSMTEVLFHEISHVYLRALRNNLPNTMEGQCDMYGFMMEDIYYHNGTKIFETIAKFLYQAEL